MNGSLQALEQEQHIRQVGFGELPHMRALPHNLVGRAECVTELLGPVFSASRPLRGLWESTLAVQASGVCPSLCCISGSDQLDYILDGTPHGGRDMPHPIRIL